MILKVSTLIHVCIPYIYEDDTKPVREMQHRLNPMLKEVGKRENMKLIDSGIIYPIPDSRRVSPIQVVPKKSGLTVVKYDKDEFDSHMDKQLGGECALITDDSTPKQKKDHFPLSFLDQVLERVAGCAFYCFLDGYSGYYQVDIAPEDQEKNDIYLSLRHFCF